MYIHENCDNHTLLHVPSSALWPLKHKRGGRLIQEYSLGSSTKELHACRQNHQMCWQHKQL